MLKNGAIIYRSRNINEHSARFSMHGRKQEKLKLVLYGMILRNYEITEILSIYMQQQKRVKIGVQY